MERFSTLHKAFARDVLKQARRIVGCTEHDLSAIHLVPLAELDGNLQAVTTELDLVGRLPAEAMVAFDETRLRALSNALLQMANDYEATIVGGTKEQWSAAINVKDASRLLFSAAAWLNKQEART